jgi:hypothetical protein
LELHLAEINAMKHRLAAFACVVVATGFVAAFANGLNTSNAIENPSLAPFEFNRTSAASPEEAATALFRGVATESPKHFVQHLHLGVCDGPIDILQKFAESLHTTTFTDEGKSFTFYDLRDNRKGINPQKPVRVTALASFDTENEKVAALQFEMLSTYYGERFMCVDVAAEGYDGHEYQTRIVVSQQGDHWYAMPRCRSAKSFYSIADAMSLASHNGDRAK